jgi:predicted RNA-binding Zn-ribbon protein involved in translation (DUF1610 family)
MENNLADTNRALMVDANAVAGLLMDVFGGEMTAEPTECAHCGNQAEMGTLLTFMQGPGVVFRCPACGQVVLRIVQTPGAIYLDARGAVYLKLRR